MMRLGAMLWFVAGVVSAPLPVSAFESDVHDGLTHWLALQAGYGADQATAIALGDQRVDSGDMQFIDLLTLTACGANNAQAAAAVRAHHFPVGAAAAKTPSDLAVVAGGPASRAELDTLVANAPGRESFLLFKLGEAVHVLQDSWSHQGEPDLPKPLPGVLDCDRALASAHPAARGGWNSHRADLTAEWPADTVAMAQATYEALGRFPAPAGHPRTAKPWAEVSRELDPFVRATTKTQKAAWFTGHGIVDVSFLDGISLPDGDRPFLQTWKGRKLPPLPSAHSGQHRVAPDVLAFFDAFMDRWLGGTDFKAMAAEFGAPPDVDAKPTKQGAADASNEFAARLAVWRLRDHGAVAQLAHSSKALTSRQRATIDAAVRKPDAIVRYATPAEALFPILPVTNETTPMLPYLVTALPASASSPARIVATVKLRHAPYDVVELLAEKRGEQWKIVAIDATVEH